MPGETPEPNVVEHAARHADTDDESRQAPAGAVQPAAPALERFRASDPAGSEIAPDPCFDAFSSGEPVSTSLEERSSRSQAPAVKTALARDLLLMPGEAS
ncbi:hypothetical protein [Bosea psychrotolerans]|uniref:hypothetical protein n=1 Tax=Bosea psychrotolerans TaxID=1871628 RepID=UPI0011B0BA57|nr:hypothetical protein [Bosea psychrotolerans]